MTKPDAQTVAGVVGPGMGPAVLAGTATLRAIPIPGVGDDDADHPAQAHVGAWPDGTVRMLSDDQPAFFDLVAAAGADVRDPETALGYVRAFLEVTRGPMVIVREVGDAAELRWRPGSEAEEASRAAFEAGPPLEPAVAEASGDGFHVELTLVVDQRVQRNTFDVGRDGSIRSSYRVLARDLPLPIAR